MISVSFHFPPRCLGAVGGHGRFMRRRGRDGIGPVRNRYISPEYLFLSALSSPTGPKLIYQSLLYGHSWLAVQNSPPTRTVGEQEERREE